MDDSVAIDDVMEQMVIPRTDHVKAEFGPVSENETWFMFASTQMPMCLYIRFDRTHFVQYNMLDR